MGPFKEKCRSGAMGALRGNAKKQHRKAAEERGGGCFDNSLTF